MKYFIAVLTLLLASCSVYLEVHLYNNTAHAIIVETSTDKVEVLPGAVGIFRFTSDARITIDGKIYTYRAEWSDLSAYSYGAITKNKIKGQLNDDLQLFVVLPSSKLPTKDPGLQPKGFPKTPVS